MHKVCICILGAHYFRLYSDEYLKCAGSMHLVCNCILIAFFWAFFVRCAQCLHLQTLQTLCTLLILNKIEIKTKCAISLHIFSKSRCAASLHPVCMHKVFTKCLHSLHKVCIYFHNLFKKGALSVPDADFADLVHTRLSLSLASWDGLWASTWPMS